MLRKMITVIWLWSILFNVDGFIVNNKYNKISTFQRKLKAFKGSGNNNEFVNGQGNRKRIRNTDESQGAIRLNKCLSSLSRRASDDAIAEGRVTVNNNVAKVI